MTVVCISIMVKGHELVQQLLLRANACSHGILIYDCALSYPKMCYRIKAGSQNDARPCVALRRHALTLAATQPNARIDSNPIPAFPRVAFERQIEKNCANSIVSPLAKFNATQRKAFASTCEPALIVTTPHVHT